jgi:hypothetical protein
MNVHLIRSSDFSAQTYQSVLQIVRQYEGPIEFLASESDALISNAIEVEIETKEAFEKAEEISHTSLYKEEKIQAVRSYETERPRIFFPHKTKRANWKHFFDACEYYRSARKLPPEDLVILLTDTANEANWFGGADKTMKNAFIHTADWHHYFDGLNERFPIAYEIIAWTIRMLIVKDHLEMPNYWHNEPRGCMSDFCQNKRQIVLKMRTADICMDCMKLLQSSKVDVRIFGQLIDALEGVRKYFLSIERSTFLNRPSTVLVSGYLHRIFFPAYGNLELNLNPKQRAIYCFFLRHPEGVRLVELVDHRSEIGALYHRFSNFGSIEEIEDSLNLLLDPLDNNLNETLSRIRSTIKRTLGPRISPNYQIVGSRGEPYRINLDAELIQIESQL